MRFGDSKLKLFSRRSCLHLLTVKALNMPREQECYICIAITNSNGCKQNKNIFEKIFVAEMQCGTHSWAVFFKFLGQNGCQYFSLYVFTYE